MQNLEAHCKDSDVSIERGKKELSRGGTYSLAHDLRELFLSSSVAFYTGHTAFTIESEVAQSCPTPSNPMDCGLSGSSIHGICQARVLEWVAIAFSALVTREMQIKPQDSTTNPLE